MISISKIRRQYKGDITFGILGSLRHLEEKGYEIKRIKRLNKDGDCLVTAKKGKKTVKLKLDFVGDRI